MTNYRKSQIKRVEKEQIYGMVQRSNYHEIILCGIYIKILHGGSWITFFSIKTTSGNDLSEQEKAYTRPTSPIRWKGHCKSILSKKMTGIFFIVTRLQPKLTPRERFWTLMSGGAHHNIKWGGKWLPSLQQRIVKSTPKAHRRPFADTWWHNTSFRHFMLAFPFNLSLFH